jgi:2-iminobutanoate/2-iminopropanoate deaminase
MNTRSLVSTDKAAPAAGPYSQATRTEQFVFASGQLPIDPASGNIPDGIEQQTRQSLANLSAVLEAGGASLASVLKTTVVPEKHGRFCHDEWNLRRGLQRCAARALDDRSRALAEGCIG